MLVKAEHVEKLPASLQQVLQRPIAASGSASSVSADPPAERGGESDWLIVNAQNVLFVLFCSNQEGRRDNNKINQQLLVKAALHRTLTF